MNEEKAVKTLTAVLVKHFGIQIIQDNIYKERLFKDASYIFQFSEPFIMGYDQFYMKNPDSEGNKYRFGFVNTERTKKQYMNAYSSLQEAIDKEEGCKGANYFFVGDLIQEKDRAVHFFVTPYSIIGSKEAQSLREMFYRDVPPDILSAMYTLGIADYTELYNIYSSGGMNIEFLENYYTYLKLENVSKKIDFERSDNHILKSRIESLLGMGIGEFNRRLDKKVRHLIIYGPYSNGEEPYTLKQCIEQTKGEAKAYSQFSKYLNLLPKFFDFVFTLPLEDQNTEVNKKILSVLAENLDYIGILAKEYSNGENFQEYFNWLNREKQEKVVDSLKTLPERRPIYDSFLWSKGFKDLSLDYLTLYQSKPKDFIEYFKTKSPKEKKVIIKDVMESDSSNEEVVAWLNQNEQDIIREVGFNG